MNRAEINGIIRCKGRKVTISKIYDSYYCEDSGWMIEGEDQNGRYFMWKQYFDGGNYEAPEAVKMTAGQAIAEAI